MLEHPHQIDMALKGADGTLVLVVNDESVTSDPRARLAAFLAKLRAYASYVRSADFVRENPGVKPEDVQIRVLARHAPTTEMRGVEAVSLGDGTPRAIPVRFEPCPAGAWTDGA